MTIDKRYFFATVLCIIYYVAIAVSSIKNLYKIDYFYYFPIFLYCLMLRLTKDFFVNIYSHLFGYYLNWKLSLIACVACLYAILKAGLDFYLSPLIAFGTFFLLRIVAGALLWRRKCAHETQNNS